MDIYHEQSKNVLRTWVLMISFLVVIIGLGYVLAAIYDSPIILYIAIIFSFFMNFFSYWYSDKITLSLYKAQPVTSAASPMLWNAVENMAITAGLPMPKVYVIPDPAPNAFATGRNKEHAAIAVTSGLLALLTKTELEGVVAHEMSHIGNRDILIGTVVVVLLGFVSILSNIFLRSMWLGGGNRGGGNKNNNAGSILMLVGIVLAIFSPIALTLIQLAISRKREYLADADGALLTRYPEGLASALEKIRDYARPMVHANHATAHLFIANPLKGVGKKAASLFDTHPPIEKRIAILKGMEAK